MIGVDRVLTCIHRHSSFPCRSNEHSMTLWQKLVKSINHLFTKIWHRSELFTCARMPKCDVIPCSLSYALTAHTNRPSNEAEVPYQSRGSEPGLLHFLPRIFEREELWRKNAFSSVLHFLPLHSGLCKEVVGSVWLLKCSRLRHNEEWEKYVYKGLKNNDMWTKGKK